MRRGLVSSCRQLNVSRDLVAQDLKHMGSPALLVAGCFVDSIVERRDDRANLLVIDRMSVSQSRDDSPEGELGGVVHVPCFAYFAPRAKQGQSA